MGDFGKYIQLHRILGDIAHECARIAAYDELRAAEFGTGLLDYTAGNMTNLEVKDLSCDIFYDDSYAYARVALEVDGLFETLFSSNICIAVESRCAYANELEILPK